MRYYAIKIDGAPAAQFPEVPGAPVAGAQFSSVADVGYGKQNDPGALRCMLRIEMVSLAAVNPNSFVRLYGVDIEMLKQASQLTGKNIEVYAGFWPGLPLATEEAPYAGAIYCGIIWQAFGNWQDEDMTLDMLLSVGNTAQGAAGGGETAGESTSGSATSGGAGGAPTPTRLQARQRRVGNLRPMPRRRRVTARPLDGSGGIGDALGSIGGDIGQAISAVASSFAAGIGWGSTPANLIHNWQPGDMLSNALRQTLTKAFPWCTIDIGIADLLTNAGAQDTGFYSSLEQFAAFAKQTSLSLMSGIQGAAGTMSSLVGAMAKGSGNAGLQTLANSLSAAGKNSPGSDDYKGIQTFVRCQRIIVTDNNPISGIHSGPTLKFEELIGQPTWLTQNTITFRTPMRADIYPPLTVTLPPDTLEFVAPSLDIAPGVVNSLNVNFANQAVTLQQVTIVGDSRHPDGSSWSLQCTGLVTNSAMLANSVAAPLISDVTQTLLGQLPSSIVNPPAPQRRRAVRRYAV
jgi:hypothetical protein